MHYQNPIIPGFNPDPSICFAEDTFYLVTSTFEFFPGVPVYKSKNLAEWECIGHCLTRKSQLNLEGCGASGGIYAPTIRYHKGTFFMVVTNVSDKGNFIVHTTDPAGEWSEPAWVKQGGIDPSLLFDEDKVYFVSNGDDKGHHGIYLCEVNPFTGEMLTDSVLISNGCGGRCAEAPHIYHIGDMYYLMLAEGGTEYGHMVTISRSSSIYGPFEACTHNPVLSHRDDNTSPIQCTGHADLIEDKNGNWWMVALGVRPLSSARGGVMLHNLGRETFLIPVVWENGWPVVGNNGRASLSVDAPLPADLQGSAAVTNKNFVRAPRLEEQFEKEHWHQEFTFVRNPVIENYKLLPEEEVLLLKGSTDTLSTEFGAPTFLGVRQTEFCQEASTVVTLENMGSEKEMAAAGLSVFYNHDHHYDILITPSETGYDILLRRKLYDLCAITNIAAVTSNQVSFKVAADSEYYSFYYAQPGETWKLLGKGSAAGMTTEITRTMTFTGTFFGMFAENTAARFHEFIRTNEELV